jgi:hypothetical protein
VKVGEILRFRRSYLHRSFPKLGSRKKVEAHAQGWGPSGRHGGGIPVLDFAGWSILKPSGSTYLSRKCD